MLVLLPLHLGWDGFEELEVSHVMGRNRLDLDGKWQVFRAMFEWI